MRATIIWCIMMIIFGFFQIMKQMDKLNALEKRVVTIEKATKGISK